MLIQKHIHDKSFILAITNYEAFVVFKYVSLCSIAGYSNWVLAYFIILNDLDLHYKYTCIPHHAWNFMFQFISVHLYMSSVQTWNREWLLQELHLLFASQLPRIYSVDFHFIGIFFLI